MKFLIETGREAHTTSWQWCKAEFVEGKHAGNSLYTAKDCIDSTEWLSDRHACLVKSVYDLPNGTLIAIRYDSFCRPEHFIIQLDDSLEVTEYEIGTSRLRTYTMKGRYRVEIDLVEENKRKLKQSQEVGF